MSVFSRTATRGRTCAPEDLGLEKVPVERYVSEDFYEREKETLWRNSWLLVGRENEIANPGDYFLFELEVLSASVIVVRGRDAKIRAFRNACKHRGAKVRYQSVGTCRAMTCTFHGWVYGLDGRLIDVPFRDQFKGCELNGLSLDPVHVDVWGGFVFIHLGESPRHTLAEYLQPLPAQLQAYFAEEDWKFHFGYKGVFRANWKIMVDVQAEGHHGPFLHRRTVPAGFQPEHVPAVAFPDSIGVPYWLGAYRPADDSAGAIQQTAVSRLALKYGPASLYTEKNSVSVMNKYPGAVNPPGHERWMFDDYALFPNTVFLVLDRQLIIQRCWPLGPHETAWEINHYFCGAVANFGELFSREHGILGEWHTITEDLTTVEGIHQSFRSGAIDGMYLSDLEVGVRSYQKRILEEVGAPRAEPSISQHVNGGSNARG